MTEEPRLNGQDAEGAPDRYIVTTIPVHVEVGVQQTVLTLDEAEIILRDASSVALGPCFCRVEAQRCDAPIETCLALNRDREELDADGFGDFEQVTVERALQALRASHEAGLVHLAYRKPGQPITEFCSCCSCCCWMLSNLEKADYRSQVVESAFLAVQDRETCIACGACVERCPFGAWTADENGEKPWLESMRCFGCGVCVSSCPVGAISLVKRTTTPVSD